MSDTNQIKSPHVHDDQIGKPFLVVDQNTRRCLVCEQMFTRRQAPEHAKVICYPTTSECQSQRIPILNGRLSPGMSLDKGRKT